MPSCSSLAVMQAASCSMHDCQPAGQPGTCKPYQGCSIWKPVTGHASPSRAGSPQCHPESEHRASPALRLASLPHVRGLILARSAAAGQAQRLHPSRQWPQLPAHLPGVRSAGTGQQSQQGNRRPLLVHSLGVKSCQAGMQFRQAGVTWSPRRPRSELPEALRCAAGSLATCGKGSPSDSGHRQEHDLAAPILRLDATPLSCPITLAGAICSGNSCHTSCSQPCEASCRVLEHAGRQGRPGRGGGGRSPRRPCPAGQHPSCPRSPCCAGALVGPPLALPYPSAAREAPAHTPTALAAEGGQRLLAALRVLCSYRASMLAMPASMMPALSTKSASWHAYPVEHRPGPVALLAHLRSPRPSYTARCTVMLGNGSQDGCSAGMHPQQARSKLRFRTGHGT